jgi:dihydrofolate reductase
MQVSIDGYVASAVPESQWQLWDWGPRWPWTPDLRAHFNDRLAAAAGIVLSRPMVNEGYLAHWSRTADQFPDDPDYAFARRIRSVPKYVLSVAGTPEAEWRDTTVLNGPLADTLERAKQEAGGDLFCFGGATFAKALLQHDLVDELELFTNPGVAGSGTAIFDASMIHHRYRGVASAVYACGIVVTRWASSPG